MLLRAQSGTILLFQNDWRLFDGDFFRSSGIAGGVKISHCIVEHAFNAVHGFNPAIDPRLSWDFAVHDCQFSFIRDNVFEPEDHAQNWWYYPLAGAANGNRLSAQFRVVPLLHAGVEGVEIHLHNPALRLWPARLLSGA